MTRRIRTVLFSTLFPSSARPVHGVFVETRLRELLKTGQIETRVIAPVPWFPSRSERWGDRAKMARTPRDERREGIEVVHPRYPLLPKVGMNSAPFLLALAAAPSLRRLIAGGFDFDLIDAHYLYPDGVAAAILASWFGKPFVMTARGSDVNLIGRYRWPRQLMARAVRASGTTIGVSQALVDVLGSWSVPKERLRVVRNGVDLERFRPLPSPQARVRLGIEGGPVLLSVGNLVELKGHDLTIDAVARLRLEHPAIRFLLIGTGPERARLEAQVDRLGLASCVRFVGSVPNAGLADWYAAADVSVLSSSREGWANVLLESMACGTPVVGTRRGGTPEVICNPVAGRVVDQRDATHIADAIGALLRQAPERAKVRHHAERFGWQESSEAQLRIFDDVLSRGRAKETACAI